MKITKSIGVKSSFNRTTLYIGGGFRTVSSLSRSVSFPCCVTIVSTLYDSNIFPVRKRKHKFDDTCFCRFMQPARHQLPVCIPDFGRPQKTCLFWGKSLDFAYLYANNDFVDKGLVPLLSAIKKTKGLVRIKFHFIRWFRE